MARQPRISRPKLVHNRAPIEGISPAHLVCVRKVCLCLGCGRVGRVIAHHLISIQGPERRKGMGIKERDKDSVPLCEETCHGPGVPGSVHDRGDEIAWFAERGIDHYAVASALWRVTGDIDAMYRVVFRARQMARAA